jgi:hypothetical protein
VPNVLPLTDGIASVELYRVQLVESVIELPVASARDEVEGEPPEPKFCEILSPSFGVPAFATAQNEIVTVFPARRLTSSIDCVSQWYDPALALPVKVLTKAVVAA